MFHLFGKSVRARVTRMTHVPAIPKTIWFVVSRLIASSVRPSLATEKTYAPSWLPQLKVDSRWYLQCIGVAKGPYEGSASWESQAMWPKRESSRREVVKCSKSQGAHRQVVCAFVLQNFVA